MALPPDNESVPTPKPAANIFLNESNTACFCLFLFYTHDKYNTNTITYKRVDGVLGLKPGAAGW